MAISTTMDTLENGTKASNKTPTFEDIQGLLNAPIQIKQPTSISPITQSMIDILQKRAESAVRAGAVRRGMEGSSTELFNIGRATTEAALPLIQSDIERQTGVATSEAQLNLNRLISLGGLTSDEIASLRYMDDAEKNRFLQEKLGGMQIGAAMSAADKQEHAASTAAKSGIWGSLIGGAAAGGTAAAVARF